MRFLHKIDFVLRKQRHVMFPSAGTEHSGFGDDGVEALVVGLWIDGVDARQLESYADTERPWLYVR